MKKEVDMSEVGRGLVRMEPGLTKKPVKPSQALLLWIQTTQKIACLRVRWLSGECLLGEPGDLCKLDKSMCTPMIPVLWHRHQYRCTHSLAANPAQGW